MLYQAVQPTQAAWRACDLAAWSTKSCGKGANMPRLGCAINVYMPRLGHAINIYILQVASHSSELLGLCPCFRSFSFPLSLPPSTCFYVFSGQMDSHPLPPCLCIKCLYPIYLRSKPEAASSLKPILSPRQN